jgi:type I restriction enzyme S subunit
LLPTGDPEKHYNLASISSTNIMELPVVLPSPQEREGIAAFLDSETIRLNALIADAQEAIALLQERRTALISAAVTGKIDVRGLVAIPEIDLVRSCG